MNKVKILTVFLLLALFSKEVSAQTPDELRKFAEVQQALAGDPDQWRARYTDLNKFFYHAPINPKQVLEAERLQRTDAVLNSNPAAQADKDYIRYYEALYDEESEDGKLLRQQAGGTLLSGNYKLQSTAGTELGRIKDIYEQITTRVARYAEPSGDKPSSCLLENMGMCRHMAIILQESMEEYGITSELVVSPKHAWVRVTLSDPQYAGTTFDLDPTWYAHPIPLAPRDGTPLSAEWEKLMIAILPTATPTITPTPSISPTPTITLTPTPTISATPIPTPPEEEDTGSDDGVNNTGPSNDNDDQTGGGWVIPR